jgi:predicted NBD/HSP70 family sugar kinase
LMAASRAGSGCPASRGKNRARAATHVGVDRGGTRIEAIGPDPEGVELARVRQDSPRPDYRACISRIRDLVRRIEAGTGRTGSVGIGLPGSVDPRTGIAKGASSTWLNGKPVLRDLRSALLVGKQRVMTYRIRRAMGDLSRGPCRAL